MPLEALTPFSRRRQKKNGIYPHITQMNADEEFLNRRERRERRKISSSLPSFASVENVFRRRRGGRILNPCNPVIRGQFLWLRLCRDAPFAPFRGRLCDTSIIAGAALAPPCRAVPIPRGRRLPPSRHPEQFVQSCFQEYTHTHNMSRAKYDKCYYFFPAGGSHRGKRGSVNGIVI
jgi:hypothetical protein